MATRIRNEACYSTSFITNNELYSSPRIIYTFFPDFLPPHAPQAAADQERRRVDQPPVPGGLLLLGGSATATGVAPRCGFNLSTRMSSSRRRRRYLADTGRPSVSIKCTTECFTGGRSLAGLSISGKRCKS
jgi:hypothetical protein